jgi:hypothetical protein
MGAVERDRPTLDRQLRNGKSEQNAWPYDEELDRLLDEMQG